MKTIIAGLVILAFVIGMVPTSGASASSTTQLVQSYAPAPAAPATSKKVVYRSLQYGTGDLFTISSEDGTGRTRLTYSGAMSPSWSPDGTKIAYDAGGKIVIVYESGNEWKHFNTTIGNETRNPIWSPDGKRILYACTNTKLAIWDIDPNTVQEFYDVSNNGMDAVWPSDWSNSGILISAAYSSVWSVYEISDSKVFRQILLGSDAGNNFMAGAYSPDGSQIVVNKRKNNNWVGFEIINRNEPKEQSIINVGPNIVGPWATDWGDDNRIYFYDQDQSIPGGKPKNIYSVKPDGSDLRQLTNDTYCNLDAKVQPVPSGLPSQLMFFTKPADVISGSPITTYAWNNPHNLSKHPLLLPVLLPDIRCHWWLIDYWCDSYHANLPQKMSGEFIAIDNTIKGLWMGDQIKYLPINVAYGIDDTNCIWF